METLFGLERWRDLVLHGGWAGGLGLLKKLFRLILDLHSQAELRSVLYCSSALRS